MRIRILLILAAGLIAIGWSQAVLAQSQPTTNVNMAAQISAARKANATLMRKYTWESRTELIEKGQREDIRIEAVSYSPDGQLQRKLLNDQASPLPESLLGHVIAEKRRERLEAYVKGLRSLLEQYSLPTEANVLSFMNQATTTNPDAQGLISISGSSVLLPGDSLSVWIEASTRQTRKTQVNTFYEGEAVKLTATFKTLASGLNYVAFADVTIPGKAFTVQVHNYDYKWTGATPPPQVTRQKPAQPKTAAPAPKATVPPAAAPSFQTIEQKLKDLKSLFDQGLISQSEYDAKKAQVLKDF